MSFPCIEVNRVSKSFSVVKIRQTVMRTLKALLGGERLIREHWVLRDITFDIRSGEKWAVIGQNGAGKTTLLRLLAGIFEPTSGTVITRGRVSALFSIWACLNAELSLIDNIYFFGALHGMDRRTFQGKIDGILELSGLYPFRFTPLKAMSVGQQQRLALSVFFSSCGDINIFDEAMANIDPGFVQKCELFFDELARSDKTVIMTSHDHSFLRRFCRQAFWLQDGRIRMRGDVNDVIEAYEMYLESRDSVGLTA